MVHRSGKTQAGARAALLASCAVLLSAGWAAAADAQTAASAAATEEVQDSDAVDDIVVTAQRREERLQTVPISITAITGAEIQNADIKDINRLEQVVPGLRIARSGPAERPAIRGIFTEAAGINSDPRIGFYIDEVYQSRSQQGSVGFIDLERVEVQKGPQGTLFGRNSLGGNIALATAAPKDRFEGGLDLIYGNYNRMKAEGFINVPLADGLAFRVAAATDSHDGYLKSIVNKRADLQDLDYGFVRGSLRWTPSSLGGRLDVTLRASYYREQDNGFNTINGKVIGALVDPTLIREPGQSVTYNGVTYPLPFGYNGGNYTGSLYPYTTALRDGLPDVNGADIGIPVPGPYASVYDFPARQDQKSQNYTATVNFDVTSGLRLRSITGFTKFDSLNVGDGDGGPIPLSAYYAIVKAKTFTQEFQLQSANRASPLQYTLGAFYMNDENNDAGALFYPRHDYTTAGAAAQGLPALYAVGNTCGFTYTPLRAPSSCLLSNANSPDSASPAFAKTKSYAGYGQLSYTFDDKLTLTAGARYTVDDKVYKNVTQSVAATTFVGTYVAAQNAAATAAGRPAPFPNTAGYHAVFPLDDDSATFANFDCGGLTPGDFAPAGSNTVVGTVPNYFQTRCGARKFKYWSYRVAADYRPTPDNMVYASYSKGVHSGGFGAGIGVATTGQGDFATFETESVQAFEIGSKNQFLNNRLQVNATAFYNEYSDVQVQGLQYLASIPGTITTIYNNSGKLRVPGAELQVIYKPLRALTLTGAVTYMRARADVSPQPIYYSGLCTISSAPAGTPASQNPCNGFAGTSYFQSMAGLGSGFFPNPLTNPELFTPFTTNAAGVVTSYQSLVFNKKLRQQNVPDWSANFGAAYEADLGRAGTLTPEANVVYSGQYLLSPSLPNFEQVAYAKVDLRLTYRTADGHMSVQAFVQNLSNIATLGRVTTQNLNVQGTYAEPRTFGAKLGFRF